ncbi:MAG: hypothetical protein O3B90_03300 [Actinomycetota bacterium]|jgi:hypothetical protein|uniref:hypothetical protein n=1 Tax=uncultured Ilumatobacter sp. TaxID=879968 RepID=UPI00374E9D4C|nr:hypothetical protein [Actinomycetota bacterium]
MDVALRDIHDDVVPEGGNDVAAVVETPPLASVLAALGDRVAPVSMARERVLPVAEHAIGLFSEGGLVRGRVLSCRGMAATSASLDLVAAAVTAGSWLAVIDVPTLGLDAASELRVPLERIVAIDTSLGEEPSEANVAERADRWADVVAAAADGFEVMLTRVPAEVTASTMRKVAIRLQQRGVVMLVLGDPGSLVCDGVIDTTEQVWSGVGVGWGHLQQRTVDMSISGRRAPGRRCVSLALPFGDEATPSERDTEDAVGNWPPLLSAVS